MAYPLAVVPTTDKIGYPQLIADNEVTFPSIISSRISLVSGSIFITSKVLIFVCPSILDWPQRTKILSGLALTGDRVQAQKGKGMLEDFQSFS